jgi:hypothetical protein
MIKSIRMRSVANVAYLGEMGNLGVAGRIIFKWILKQKSMTMQTIHLTQNRVKLEALVNSFRYHKKQGICSLVE